MTFWKSFSHFGSECFIRQLKVSLDLTNKHNTVHLIKTNVHTNVTVTKKKQAKGINLNTNCKALFIYTSFYHKLY